jgi:serine/threonine-protein kinase
VNDGGDGLVGQVLLGRLKVIRRIGAGGMGAVYEVEHLITHHHRALKVLHGQYASSAEAVSRLVREAGVAGKVGTDLITETFDVGQLEDGSTYILMELLEGSTLGELIETHGRFAPSAAVRITRRVCEGLAQAHDAGFIHRDIKPDNIFLVGGDPIEARIKILDFGIATLLPGYDDRFDNLTRTGATPGTPMYMAPEQMREDVTIDGRADLYALGLVLYEMLAGRRPYDATTLVGLVTQVQHGDYVPLSTTAEGIDPALESIVHRAMHRDAEARYPDARSLAAALAPFEADSPSNEARTPPASPVLTTDPVTPPRQARRSLVLPLAAIAILGAAAIALLGGYLFITSEETGGAPQSVESLPEADEALEESIAGLARRGRSNECLERAMAAPASPRILRLRLACARAAEDWSSYEQSCELQASRHPNAPETRNCRENLRQHESGVQ